MLQDHEMTTPTMVVGIFSTLRDAESAIRGLESLGLTSREISVISSNTVVKEHFEQYRPDAEPEDWKAAAVLGGTTGAVLAGLTSVAALVTGAGIPIVVAGGLASFITGGIVGGLAGVMAERGFETEAADYYELAVAEGKVLVAVDLSQRTDAESLQNKIESVLGEAGSEPIELTKNPDFSSK